MRFIWLLFSLTFSLTSLVHADDGLGDDLSDWIKGYSPSFSVDVLACQIANAVAKDQTRYFDLRVAAARNEKKFMAAKALEKKLWLEFEIPEGLNKLANRYYDQSDGLVDWAVLAVSPKTEGADPRWYMAYNELRYTDEVPSQACATKGLPIGALPNFTGKPGFFREVKEHAQSYSKWRAEREIAMLTANDLTSQLSSFKFDQYIETISPLIYHLLKYKNNSLTPHQIFGLALNIYNQDPLLAISAVSRLFYTESAMNRCKFRNAVVASRQKNIFKEDNPDRLAAGYHFWGYLVIGLTLEDPTCANLMSFGYECVAQRLDTRDRTADTLGLKVAAEVKKRMVNPSLCKK